MYPHTEKDGKRAAPVDDTSLHQQRQLLLTAKNVPDWHKRELMHATLDHTSAKDSIATAKLKPPNARALFLPGLEKE